MAIFASFDLTPERRRLLRGTAVGCGVLAGHILVFAALCWRPQPEIVTATGSDGRAVMMSLVSPQLSADAELQPEPVTAPQKPLQQARLAAVDLAVAEPVAKSVEGMTQSADDPSREATPQLSESDRLALEQFEPVALAGAPGDPCNLAGGLAATFAQSPQVRQGLDQLPASERSVANAVNLWDGHWPAESLSGGRALLRALLVKAVSAAPPVCLGQPNRGPLLVFVPEGATTAVLAIGSGEWTWGDLLDGDALTSPQLAANTYFPTAASVVLARP